VKFQVKELAKIQEASIEVKDLTVFVGKNSTNKSYMAHTVYMLNKVLSKISTEKNTYIVEFFNSYRSSKANLTLIESLQEINFSEQKNKMPISIDKNRFELEELRTVTFTFSQVEINKFIECMSDFIVDEILNIINKSFNINRNVVKKIFFSTYNYDLFDANSISFISDDSSQDYGLVLYQIFKQVILNLSTTKISRKEFYFPASRTGFVLAFDEIVSGVLRDRFGGQPTATKLTEPTIDFISGFSDIKSGKFEDIVKMLFDGFVMSGIITEDGKSSDYNFSDANHDSFKNSLQFINNRLLKGQIIEDKNSQNYTQFYMQTNDKQKLDLHMTSSSTLELLPLVVFLKHFKVLGDKFLVIEEPEAHLHPKAQVEMARLLVMLVNSGAKVLITTHSDYILNELSNCIKLSSINDKKKEKYLKRHDLPTETIIDKKRVSSYLFKDLGDITEVIDLTIDKYGIANDNFDDILDELLDRTEEINELIGL